MSESRSYLAKNGELISTELRKFDQKLGGFRFAGINCGIKSKNNDLAAILCPVGTAAAACLTQNKLAAPCVHRNRLLFPNRDLRAIVINSGNANAMNGLSGEERNQQIAEQSAAILGCEPVQIATSSTGVIGVPLPIDTICSGLDRLFREAVGSRIQIQNCAQAILTTDTCTKIALGTCITDSGNEIRVLGLAKGSGMIHPNMATTLAYVCIEANIDADYLQSWLKEAVDDSFNAITVDGDCSTNDMVIAMAHSERPATLSISERNRVLSVASAVLESLAVAVVEDGEGATRLLELQVRGATTNTQARELARSMARNTLFRCSAFAGSTSAWGRLAAAIGQAAFEHNIEVDPSDLDISVGGNLIVGRGQPRSDLSELSDDLERVLQNNKVVWEVRFASGPGTATIYFCDLSYDYIRINADEDNRIHVGPRGNIYRRLGLDAYSPTLKHQLLVDALGYAKRFVGLRIMIHARGSILRNDRLFAAFVSDLQLMSAADIRILLVVPGNEKWRGLEQYSKSWSWYQMVDESIESIADRLDRGDPCISQFDGDLSEVIDIGISLGMEKIIAISDAAGLIDPNGAISALSAEQAEEGIRFGNVRAGNEYCLEFVKQTISRCFPALHLIDGRTPHAIVGELFTTEGVGTLITRQRLHKKFASISYGQRDVTS